MHKVFLKGTVGFACNLVMLICQVRHEKQRMEEKCRRSVSVVVDKQADILSFRELLSVSLCLQKRITGLETSNK